MTLSLPVPESVWQNILDRVQAAKAAGETEVRMDMEGSIAHGLDSYTRDVKTRLSGLGMQSDIGGKPGDTGCYNDFVIWWN